MKYSNTVEATDSLGDQERADFKFAVNGKAFKIILDDMYSNKIRGLARELASNAIDAQIEARVTRPFDIFLPTDMYPEFRIRDFGTGLCHEDVMTMYVTLFDSTKDDSNDVTGAFGLGSKIPFAYGDAFIVTSYYHGEQRTYSCNIGEGGVPGITYIKELTQVTDEPNGLEVTVSVRPGDYQEFADELAHLSLAFEPKPNVIGGSYSPVVPEWISSDGKVQVIPRHYYNSMFCIKQGSAIYPVDDYRSTAGFNSIVSDDYSRSLIIDVPIGTVAISPNREALSIDDNTREALSREIGNALDMVIGEVEESLNACSSRLQVLDTYNETLKFLTKASKVDLAAHSKDGDWKPGDTILLSGGADWEILRGRKGNSREKLRLNAFSYKHRHQLVFVISYTNQPVVREGTRYRQFVSKIQDSYGDHREPYLIKDPTPKQIERLYTLLGLNSEQLISVASLPDPGPPIRVKQEDKKLAGVRPHSDKAFSPDELDELPAKYYWYQLDRYNSLNERRTYGYAIRDAVSHDFLEADVPVIVFSKSALKKHLPSSQTNIYTAIENSKVRIHDKIVASKLRRMLLGTISNPLVWAELGVDISAMDATHSGVESAAALTEASEQHKLIVDPLKQMYPLLFGFSAFEDIVCYIEDRNNATEGNQS